MGPLQSIRRTDQLKWRVLTSAAFAGSPSEAFAHRFVDVYGYEELEWFVERAQPAYAIMTWHRNSYSNDYDSDSDSDSDSESYSSDSDNETCPGCDGKCGASSCNDHYVARFLLSSPLTENAFASTNNPATIVYRACMADMPWDQFKTSVPSSPSATSANQRQIAHLLNELDLSSTLRRFQATLDPAHGKANAITASRIEAEYRKFLVLQVVHHHLDDSGAHLLAAPDPIHVFWGCHVVDTYRQADSVSQARKLANVVACYDARFGERPPETIWGAVAWTMRLETENEGMDAHPKPSDQATAILQVVCRCQVDGRKHKQEVWDQFKPFNRPTDPIVAYRLWAAGGRHARKLWDWAVYYTLKQEFVGDESRRLFQIQVPDDHLFDEAFAHRFVDVYAYEELKICPRARGVAEAWFAERARMRFPTYPFVEWSEYMRDVLDSGP
ncbi:hypothetical protein BCR44DRAFT_1497034 [Catenaria anguillulae PL171]|uniref:Uncharacterized protein n=1 Tax=Catenaria anguillulae PL171 TaxID=765915 RepID=A0A1Y2HWJ6_9FUNG|nr:hypothetical protein BCR44DRAFT_1497034 [Catenaria anguillulae PL171]